MKNEKTIKIIHFRPAKLHPFYDIHKISNHFSSIIRRNRCHL